MSGSISIPNFPSNWRVPSVYVGSSPAGSVAGIGNVGLILGQMLANGTATPAVPVLAVNQANVNSLCGPTSMIAAEYAMAYANDPTTTWYIQPLADAVGSTASTTVLTIAVANSAVAGSIPLSINNVPVSTAVTVGQTANAIANAMAVNVNLTSLPVTATANGATVTLTATNKGLTAGNIPVVVAPYGASQGQILPTGVTVTATYTPGSSDPDLANAVTNATNLGALYTCNPYANSTDLGETSAGEAISWSIIADRFGQVFTASQGSVASLVATGANYNDGYLSVMSVPAASLQSPYLWAAAYTAVAAQSFSADPSLPLTGDVMTGIAPPVNPTNFFAPSDRNTLYNNGIASWTAQGGFVYVDLPVTTYQRLSSGIADTSYLMTNTPAQLALVSTTFRNRAASDFAKKKLLPNGSPVSGYNNAVTPAIVAGHFSSYYADMVASGLCANSQAFNAGLVVQIGNPGQILVYAPITLSAPLEQIVVQMVFSL